MSCLESDLVAKIPSLKAYAFSLSCDHEIANELVQETLLKAWRSRDTFQSGTKLDAWLFTILKNSFISQYRVRKREVPLDEMTEETVVNARYVGPSQFDHVYLLQIDQALAVL